MVITKPRHGNSSSGLEPQNTRVVLTPALNNAGKGASPASISPTFVHEAPAITLPAVKKSILEAKLLSQVALVCRFNGVWPPLVDLHVWIMKNWKPLSKQSFSISPLAQGFFADIFKSPKDRSLRSGNGPWFWDSSGLFVEPWPRFDPSFASISSVSIWIRLPNMPLRV